MTKRESNIPSDAHDILRNYAEGPHYTSDLMIRTANKVESALAYVGVDFPGSGYSVATLTRLHSRDTVSHFPDSNFKYLRSPDTFRREVVEKGSKMPEVFREQYRRELGPLCDNDDTKLTDKMIRDIHRKRVAALSGKAPEEVGNGHVRRLLDKPEICDLLIQYYNEHQVEKFQKHIAGNQYYRLGQHRLPETQNQARHERPATLGSYIARTFCPNMPAIVSAGRSESSMREERLAVRADLIVHLPIDPDTISDESLKKVGLAPEDFDKYTLQARRRYKMAVAPQFLALLAQAKMTDRPYAGKKQGEVKSTARVITFMGADGQEKIGIFSTVSDLVTKVRTSVAGDKNRHHRVADTELRIFAGREEAIRSQEHALEKMAGRLADYAKLFNGITDYKGKKPDEKASYLQGVVDEAQKTFAKKTGFYDQLIRRSLEGSTEGKPTQSILENPSIIGVLRSTLKRAIGDTKGKMAEINLLKQRI